MEWLLRLGSLARRAALFKANPAAADRISVRSQPDPKPAAVSVRSQPDPAGVSALSFCDVALRPLEAVLARVSCPALSVLHIRLAKQRLPQNLPWQRQIAGVGRVNSLLLSAARLSPEEFVLTAPSSLPGNAMEVDLPSFHRAVSIKLGMAYLRLQVRDDAQFPALKTVSLSMCLVDLATLVPRCPRLQALKITAAPHTHNYDIIVHSPSLQELDVETHMTSRISIVAPELKHLTLSFYRYREFSVSISAPALQKVSWQCKSIIRTFGLGNWHLEGLSLRPSAESYELHINATYDGFSLPIGKEVFVQEVDKLLVADFCALELHLTTMGHVFGEFVLHLLGIDRIRCAIRGLKIVLQKQANLGKCRCDEPISWKSRTIALTDLEQVGIDGFNGEDHEFDFLKLIFKCAPALKRMTVRLSHQPTQDVCSQVCDIFKAHPYVECSYVCGAPRRRKC